jgi:hypothetical protein
VDGDLAERPSRGLSARRSQAVEVVVERYRGWRRRGVCRAKVKVRRRTRRSQVNGDETGGL